jgi:hypothetical protein
MADLKNKADKEKTRFALKVKLDNQRTSDEIKRLTFDLNYNIDCN